ncbi:Nre family DNA repair protein [Candidatus Nitrosocosmicus franklandus]|uniref:DNA repair protein n=1 Tax=Candidatus Nitrosocosmicus franklandianus TaxID=1798806 RepID=A0A484IF15_9ARCH|nr:Nre family DNA repair protein [Candidatus Nitrosocosmicus franklandus]VFJ14611.1 conserved protein of unknown function [Candidatus Nitrosocosmicus franklandus]
MSSRSSSEIKERIRQNWNNLLKEKLSKVTENLTGRSPPSVFVGSYLYPKVNIGPLVSTTSGDIKILDHPEKWAGRKLEDLINYRLSLIRGTILTSAFLDINNNRQTELLQELAMANKSIEVEVTFDKKPSLKFEEMNNLSVTDSDAIQFGFASQIKNLKIPTGISVNKKIEKAYYDKDLSAHEAVNRLYNEGIEISNLSKVFSVGVLGSRKRRKIVPTKWSITAIDQIISANLIGRLTDYSSIDSFLLFRYIHLANNFAVILIPDHIWNFEMNEAWFNSDGKVDIESDTEISGLLKNYPKICGSYFAARLAVTEYLNQHRKKASAIVLREIYPEYVLPVGVWQIREGIRMAMKRKGEIFDNLDEALGHACTNMKLSKKEWISKSVFIQSIRYQKRISEYVF